MGVSDINGDGKPDILLSNTPMGANAVCYMNGVTLSGVADLHTEVDQAWKIVGVGDFNSDVKSDILRRNIAPGPNAAKTGSGPRTG